MTRGLWAGIAAMAIVVVASNILVQFLAGNWLTWGAFTYPFAFLITDLMNRLYGTRAARKVVLAGFAVGVACSLIGSQIEGAYGPL
ncbi:MAG: VUT family protein, partial [Pseudomonadota bacterium]